MKDITVLLDDETYRRACMEAAALDMSVSALVKRHLIERGAGETQFQRLKRQERALRACVPADFRAADNLARDEIHTRHA
jgi:hypothetical protein